MGDFLKEPDGLASPSPNLQENMADVHSEWSALSGGARFS